MHNRMTEQEVAELMSSLPQQLPQGWRGVSQGQYPPYYACDGAGRARAMVFWSGPRRVWMVGTTRILATPYYDGPMYDGPTFDDPISAMLAAEVMYG